MLLHFYLTMLRAQIFKSAAVSAPYLRKGNLTSDFTFLSIRESYGIRHKNHNVKSFFYKIPNFALTNL